jgi:cytochrome c-type protein NapB
MKRSLLFAMLLAALAGCATTIGDTEFSLNKGSVFDSTNPITFDFETGTAGQALIPPPPDSGMPPMISHSVAEYLPITASSNACLGCHDRPAAGKAAAKGQAVAAPASHYTTAASGQLAVSGAQYNCLACHAPQAGVAPLVTNRSR